MSFIYCHLNFHANLLRPWRFPLTTTTKYTYDYFSNGSMYTQRKHFQENGEHKLKSPRNSLEATKHRNK